MNTPLRPIARTRLLATVVALACAATFALTAPAARAAESYDNCTGFIDTIPATISTQGVWCVRKNLTTAMTSGAAITVAGNNITIDCNEFKIGGLAAGTASQAVGVLAQGRQNVTLRRCGIRGFHVGTFLEGSGHLVEDNRFDGNLYEGIDVTGEANLVQRNRVLDTGGGTYNPAFAYAIYGEADFLDNIVEGVFPAAANASGFGIYATGFGTRVRGNRIADVDGNGTGYPRAVFASDTAIVIEGNLLTTALGANGGRAVAAPGTSTVCRANVAHGYSVSWESCDTLIDNVPASP